MIERISPLPQWHIPHLRPAVHDLESMSVLEQTGKLYGVIQELIEEYNKMVDSITVAYNDFTSNTENDQKEFEEYITRLVHDYIAMLDEKLKMQDQEIADSITYIKENITQSVKSLIDEMVDSGEFSEAIISSMSELSQKLDTLNANVASQSTRMSEIETELSSQKANITTLETNITNTDNNIAEHSNKIDGVTEELNGLTDTVANHTTSIGEHGTKITALEQKDVTHDETITNHATRIETLETAKTENDTKNVQQDTKITALESRVHGDIVTGTLTPCGYKIDGKNVYVKRINMGNLPNAKGASIAHGIDMSQYNIVEVRGVATHENGQYVYLLPYVSSENVNWNIGFFISGDIVIIHTEYDYSPYTGIINIYVVEK